ncbi:MAG: c-type cytochrome biogenesis protein CcmI, partial [Halocynthiibacter sp.]
MFWISTVSLSGLVAILLVLAVLRRQTAGQIAPAQSDLQVYRDQLRELERDVARGTLSQDEAERTKIEVSRRILEADRNARASAPPVDAPKRATLGLAVATLVFVIAATFGLYWQLGAPGYADLPLQTPFAAPEEIRENRPEQAAAEA